MNEILNDDYLLRKSTINTNTNTPEIIFSIYLHGHAPYEISRPIWKMKSKSSFHILEMLQQNVRKIQKCLHEYCHTNRSNPHARDNT